LLPASVKTTPDFNNYFPPASFLTEKTYCFVNPTDTSERALWKIQTDVSNGDTLLKTSIFNNNNRISEMMTEKILNGNSNIVSIFSTDYDSLNQLPANCETIFEFPFKIFSVIISLILLLLLKMEVFKRVSPLETSVCIFQSALSEVSVGFTKQYVFSVRKLAGGK